MPFQFDKLDNCRFETVTEFKSQWSTDPSETYENACISLSDKVLGIFDATGEDTMVLQASLDDCEQLDTFIEKLREQDEAALSEEEISDAGATLWVYSRHGVKFAVTADHNADSRLFVQKSDFNALNEYVATLDIPEE